MIISIINCGCDCIVHLCHFCCCSGLCLFAVLNNNRVVLLVIVIVICKTFSIVCKSYKLAQIHI